MFDDMLIRISCAIDTIFSRINCIFNKFRKEDADGANRIDVYDMNVNTFLSYLIKRTFCRTLKACNLKKIG